MKEKPIYLIVTGLLPEPGVWQGSYVEDQAIAIMREGTFRVVVVKPFPFYNNCEDYDLPNLHVLRCRDYTLPSHIYPNSICDRLSGNSLIRKLRQEGIESSQIAVCHTHVTSLAHYALTIKRENPNCFTIVQHHGFDVMGVTDGKLSNKQWHRNLCVRYGVKHCNTMDLNIGVSQKTLEYVHKNFDINLKREYVLYNGVDRTIFNCNSSISSSNNHLFVIGCIANFWPLKDQITLLKALKILVSNGFSDIKVKFVGHGTTFAECEQYVADNSLEKYVDFLSEVSHDKLPAFYRALSLFVLPSYWEAFGCVYTEAYACGVPFIGVKGQGISEIIPDEELDRWLIDKGDYQMLANIIKRVKANRSEIQNLKFSIDITDTIGNYIKQLVLWTK